MSEFTVDDFWNRVRTLIREKNLTQRSLSVLLGYHDRAIENWISRELFPDANQACKIAQSLGTTVEYLVTGSDDRKLPEDLQSVINKYATRTQ